MALGTYKDLCIDSGDPQRLGEFWATALGWESHPHDGGDASLRDADGNVHVWINRVRELVTVKNRLHLDVNTEDVQRLVDAGATVLDADSFPWTVLWDPEGHEFCAFVRAEPVESRFYEIGWDCADSPASCHRLAAWWAGVVGGAVTDDQEHGYSWLDGIPGTPFESIDFVPVPERKNTKNRIHIDVRVDDFDALIAHGATELRKKGDDGIGWHVMADPEGNEFCAFTPD